MVCLNAHFILGLFICTSFSSLAQPDEVALKSISHGKVETFVSPVRFEGIVFEKRSRNASPIATSLSFEFTSTSGLTTLILAWLRNGQPLEVPRLNSGPNVKPREMYSTENVSPDKMKMTITLHLHDAAITPGNYTLIVTSGSKSVAASGDVLSAPILPTFFKPKRVLEGDVFRIACLVGGYPRPAEVLWWFAPIPVGQTEDDGALAAALRHLQALDFTNTTRFSRETSPEGTLHDTLVFAHLEGSDNGLYACNTSNSQGSDISLLLVNVKNRWAALGPFIGIVLEVVILVVAILLYERHQMRSKPTTTAAPSGANAQGGCSGKPGAATVENNPVGGGADEFPPSGNRLRTLVEVPPVPPQPDDGAAGGPVDDAGRTGQDEELTQEEARLRGTTSKF